MNNWIACGAFPCIPFLAGLPFANAAAPRHSLDADASTVWLRRETFKTEPWRISQPAPIPTWSRTLAMFMDVAAKSSLGGGLSEPAPVIHNCSNNNTRCQFSSCIPEGNSASCHYGNCFTSNETDNVKCAGVADGTNVPPDEFCFAGYPMKICPPQDCVDIDFALENTSCSALKASDPLFCQQPTLQSMIGFACRYTCGLCTLATCGDKDGSGAGTSAVECPLGSFRKPGTDSAECGNSSCETSDLESIDTSTCCEPYGCSIGVGKGECKTCMPQFARTTTDHCSECNAGARLSADGTTCLAMNTDETVEDVSKTTKMANSSCLHVHMCCPDGYECKAKNGDMTCVNQMYEIARPLKCKKKKKGNIRALIFFMMSMVAFFVLSIVLVQRDRKPAVSLEEKDVLEGEIAEEGEAVEEGDTNPAEVPGTAQEETSPVPDPELPREIQEAPDPELPTPPAAPPP